MTTERLCYFGLACLAGMALALALSDFAVGGAL